MPASRRSRPTGRRPTAWSSHSPSISSPINPDRGAPQGATAPGGRIVTTSSEVHDPNPFCLMGIGRATWQDPLELADPARSQAHIAGIADRGEARSCASKLLNLMHVRHLARELPAIGVVAFNPSVVPGTEIGRDRNWLQRLGWKYLMPLFVPILPGARGLGQSAAGLWLAAAPGPGQ